MSLESEKGDALEGAVKAIETAILQLYPDASNRKLNIESKKIIKREGVRHEIDVYVEADMGNDYQSVFIFECKNQEEKVGKNDIIIFSEKISVVPAQHGFFVAQSFTSDARAQAEKDPRVTLLDAVEHEPCPMPFNFRMSRKKDVHVMVSFLRYKEDGGVDNLPTDLNRSVVKNDSGSTPLEKFISKWADAAIIEHYNEFDSDNRPEGEYRFSLIGNRAFEDGELRIDSHSCVSCKMQVNYTICLYRPAITSDFEIKGRGRMRSFAPVLIEGKPIQIGLAALEGQASDEE